MNKDQDKNWFVKWFNTQDYLELYKHRDDNDAAKIISLLFRNIKLNKNAKVLDLACGNGRHSVLFAKKGFNVTGVDLSKFLISRANEKRKSEYSKYKSRLKFEIGDMRNISHISEFELIVNLFTSFGYFNTDYENEKAAKSIANALRPGGYFLFDFLNREYLLKNLVPYDIKTSKEKVIIQIRNISERYVDKKIIIITNNAEKEYPPVVNSYMEKIRLYSSVELKRMFENLGLKIIKTFGSYEGDKFNRTKSERFIIIAQKAE